MSPFVCYQSRSVSLRLGCFLSEGLQFCGDGTCQKSCENIVNACQCGDDTVQYYPCAAGQLVNITHFDPNNQVVQTQNICAANANLSNIGTWGVSSSPSVWLSCPVAEPYFTFTEPMWVAVWCLMSAEAVILALWAIYKYFREMKFHRIMASNALDKDDLREKSSRNPDMAIKVNTQVNEAECQKDMMVSEKKQFSNTKDDSTISTSSIKESEKLKFRGFLVDYFG